MATMVGGAGGGEGSVRERTKGSDVLIHRVVTDIPGKVWSLLLAMSD